MKPIGHIKFGFSDAENYRRRENKELFNQIFLRTDAIKKLEDSSSFFLVGEKGTGKTAYAVYLSNTPTDKSRYSHKFIRETDYLKFISLKKSNNLSISEYTDIWKVILLLIIAKEISASATMKDYLVSYPKFYALNEAIDEYYSSAFSPEIVTAFNFIENSETAAKILAKHMGLNGGLSTKIGQSYNMEGKSFQTNLYYIENRLQEAISSLKLPKGLSLFIDGIDIRPSTVPYDEYLDCVKGLANAAWSLKNDYFPTIRDSPGRIKTILLLRPDIFNSLGLQNRNTKLKDNAVLLNWVTDYKTYRKGELFLLADRMFRSQQDTVVPEGAAWDHYFPFEATGILSEQDAISSFIVLLRYSYHRPRDILTILDFLKDLFIDDENSNLVFEYKHLFDPKFRNLYGEYLLGEVKDSLSFYYNNEQYELFLKFFEYLNGAQKFSYEEYIKSFTEFSQFLETENIDRPDFMKSADEFLQFLYDQNILNFIEQTEGENFIRWCFRERTSSNISPKVKFGMNYEIHYGLANTLNTGKRINRPNKGASSRSTNGTKSVSSSVEVGAVKMVNIKRRFGFIKKPELPVDIFFHASDCSEFPLQKGDKVTFSLKKSGDGRLAAKEVRKVVGR